LSESEQQYRIIRVRSDEYKDRYISNKPGCVVRLGGCEFHLFKYLDDDPKQEFTDLPRFDGTPEYTDEGRPFVLPVGEACPLCKSNDPEDPDPGDCRSCVWCYTEKPADYIGVCMCDERKLKSQEEQPK
jgi:hypothetical protein